MTDQTCDQRGHATFWTVHVHGPDELVWFDTEPEAEAYAAAIVDATKPGGALEAKSPHYPQFWAHAIAPVTS